MANDVVHVTGKATPVFGTQRPNNTTEVIVDSAKYFGESFVGDTWTMDEVVIEEGTVENPARWFVSAQVYLHTLDGVAPKVTWTDDAATAIYVPLGGFGVPRPVSDGFGLYSSDGSSGILYIYQAVFDYIADAVAAPSFQFDVPTAPTGIATEVELSVIRGVAGETNPNVNGGDCILETFTRSNLRLDTFPFSFSADLDWFSFTSVDQGWDDPPYRQRMDPAIVDGSVTFISSLTTEDPGIPADEVDEFNVPGNNFQPSASFYPDHQMLSPDQTVKLTIGTPTVKGVSPAYVYTTNYPVQDAFGPGCYFAQGDDSHHASNTLPNQSGNRNRVIQWTAPGYPSPSPTQINRASLMADYYDFSIATNFIIIARADKIPTSGLIPIDCWFLQVVRDGAEGPPGPDVTPERATFAEGDHPWRINLFIVIAGSSDLAWTYDPINQGGVKENTITYGGEIELSIEGFGINTRVSVAVGDVPLLSTSPAYWTAKGATWTNPTTGRLYKTKPQNGLHVGFEMSETPRPGNEPYDHEGPTQEFTGEPQQHGLGTFHNITGDEIADRFSGLTVVSKFEACATP